MWIKQGTEIPGMSVREMAAINSYVKQDLGITQFREDIKNIFPDGFYPVDSKTGLPPDDWFAGTLLTDLL